MQEKSVDTTRIPKFSLLSGIGGILVYLLSSLPFVLVVTAIEIASKSSSGETITEKQMNDILDGISNDPWMLVWILLVQCVCLFIYVYLVSLIRGTRNPFRDLGIRFTKSSLWFILVGVGLQIFGLVIGIPLQLLKESSSEQGVVTTVRGAQGISFIALMVMVGLIVPFAEEVCFRGLFLRGLGKKVAPIAAVLITGVVFAAIHLADPGALMGATSLLIVGIGASALAMYRGRIDASICLHIGFNLTTVLLLAYY